MTTLEQRLAERLGVDLTSPESVRAEALVENDFALLDELVRIRKDVRELTQQQVADRMGVKQSTVARFEAHDGNPTLATLRRYANAIEALVVHKVAPDTGQLQQGSSTKDAWTTIAMPAPLMAEVNSEPAGAASFRGGISSIIFPAACLDKGQASPSTQTDFALCA